MVIAASSRESALPVGTEHRLADFTELLATAIAKVQSREELRALAEEQAALRRVATLVAEATPREAVFTSVAEEIGRLLSADRAYVGRYEADDTMTHLASWSATGESLPVGIRAPGGPGTVSGLVRETGRPARVDRYAGDMYAVAREHGIGSAVAAPITVDGRPWGVIGVASTGGEPPPPDTEARLAGFTELVATAIANAQAREEVRTIAAEQAALRRVATLVASATPPAELFAAVTEEVGRLLSADVTGLVRYDADDMATLVAAHSPSGTTLPAGEPGQLRGRTLSALVRETGRPVRLDDYAEQADTQAGLPVGIRSAVGVPITVEGRVWGAISVGSLGDEPPPADTETRLSGFTELVATAIANAQTRGELEASRAESERAAEEQAALRRVATLVARVTPPTELFAAVAEEVGRLLQTDRAFVSRYEIDDAVTIVASWTASGETLPVDVRFPIQEYSLSNIVRKTRRAVRIDTIPAAVPARSATAPPLQLRFPSRAGCGGS